MKFTIALFGSFTDSAGYTWKLPQGYDQRQFENIARNFSKQYSDGRLLGKGELYGGYYIDVPKDRFFAFRFIDGDQDALGRSGVVITNWAVTRYSEVAGKNIKALFERLTLKQMPLGESIEIDLPSVFSFDSFSNASVFWTERVFLGEEVHNIFQLPSTKFHRNILIQFTVTDGKKEASIKFLSPPFDDPEKKKDIPSKNPFAGRKTGKTSSVRKIISLQKNISFILKMVVCCVGACVVLGLLFNDSKSSSSTTIKYNQDLRTDSTRQEIQSDAQIINVPGIIWTPSCIWKEKKDPNSETISNKTNRYSWGELQVEPSKLIISFAKHISLRKNDSGYAIISEKKEIGQFNDKEWVIAVEQKDSHGEYELPDVDYFLYNKEQKLCAQLTITENSISFSAGPSESHEPELLDMEKQ